MSKYDHKKIEKKWKKYWEKEKTYKTSEDKDKPKYYVLDMFPYPSGVGLHVGHPKGYIATDVVARMKMMQGYNVLHPMGWDAFGLPAENYALQQKKHPRETTEKNIEVFKKQLGMLGFTYDWDREVTTIDPKYYKWTQWAFLQMFKKGLAFESFEPINWCPKCLTGLANEDLEDGKCERCASEIEHKPMRQWVIRITDYAERLLNDLNKLNKWPTPIKEMQRNWIGKSEGATIRFSVIARSEATKQSLEVFTTRPDTLFGATYMVLAPEHKFVAENLEIITNKAEVEKYIADANKKSDLERTELAKEKTGVELKGIKAINPANGEELPVFIADYVITGYGTGAIMAVPAHDERDFEFAKKYNLPIKEVLAQLFTDSKGPDRVRPDKKTVRRKTAYILLKHWSENKYLCLDWEKFGWHSGIIGGIEKDENPVVAGRREILEETGYKNVRFIKYIGGEFHNYFFAAHKNENRYALGLSMLFQLENDERGSISAEEVEKHSTVWIKGEEMENWLNMPNYVYTWRILEGKESECFVGEGVVINSGFLNDLSTSEAKEKMISWLGEKGIGQKKVQYKLRDWVFSRQRYWGEPIPLVHCEKCGVVPMPESELPVKLPDVKNYEPSGTGESPLATIDKWVNTKCPNCGGPAKRETNTMPQWAGSCWYYLRYIDPNNDKALVDKEKEKYWSPVDFYVGGAEHATRHLIYARFWHKFLFDIGAVNYDEPFTRLQNVGLILAEDGRKMSKRWGNVINPDEIVEEYGADSMRIYEMFMGPFDQSCAWSTNGLVGARRFVEKVWALADFVIANEAKQSRGEQKSDGIAASPSAPRNDILTLLHQTIKKVSDDIENMRFNTAISQLMILVNEMNKEETISKDAFSEFIKLFSPFAPHVAEEIWNSLGNKSSITMEPWPKFDASLAKESEITLAVQVNGKLRDTLRVPSDISEVDAKTQAITSEKVQKWLEGKAPKKIIFVKGKLISIVI